MSGDKVSLPCNIPAKKKKEKLPNFYGQSFYFSVPKPKTAPLEKQDKKSDLPHSEGNDTGSSIRNFMQSENEHVYQKNEETKHVEENENAEEVVEEVVEEENHTDSHCDDNIFQFDEESPKFRSFRG